MIMSGTSNGAWEQFVKLVPDESIIFTKTGRWFEYDSEKKRVRAGLLLLTTKRVVGIEYKYKYSWTAKEIDGYRRVDFEIRITKIDQLKIFEQQNSLWLTITTEKPPPQPFDVAITFNTDDDLNSLYKEMSYLVMQKQGSGRNPKKESLLLLENEITEYFEAVDTGQPEPSDLQRVVRDVLAIINKHLMHEQ